jgi:hypothetical protein
MRCGSVRHRYRTTAARPEEDFEFAIAEAKRVAALTNAPTLGGEDLN